MRLEGSGVTAVTGEIVSEERSSQTSEPPPILQPPPSILNVPNVVAPGKRPEKLTPDVKPSQAFTNDWLNPKQSEPASKKPFVNVVPSMTKEVSKNPVVVIREDSVNEKVLSCVPLKLLPWNVYRTSACAPTDDINTISRAASGRPRQKLRFINNPFSATK